MSAFTELAPSTLRVKRDELDGGAMPGPMCGWSWHVRSDFINWTDDVVEITLGNMNPQLDGLEAQIAVAFVDELSGQPPLTLRGASEVDIGRTPPEFDAELDFPSDAYLERHGYDLPFLDAESWRHYLPKLLKLAVHSSESPSNAVDGLLSSLRPPDRFPPRLASLSATQEAAVTAVLELLAFSQASPHSQAACTALEEWWGESPLYRHGRHVA